MLFMQCQNSEEDYYETESAVNFGININDIATRNGNNDGKCLSFEEIKDLALNKKLFLVIDINGEPQKLNVEFRDNTIISKPISIVAGTHTIGQSTLIDDSYNILFSGVSKDSEFSSFVKKHHPFNITIGKDKDDLPLFSKTPVAIEMICVDNMYADLFGYVKWNVKFSKVCNLPVVVNKCDNTGEDFVGKGTIRVRNGIIGENGFIPATEMRDNNIAKIDQTSDFPLEIGTGKITFVDNYDIENKNEYFEYTLDITTPANAACKLIGYANVNDLLKYNTESNNAWEDSFNVIPINMCTNTLWFFDTMNNL